MNRIETALKKYKEKRKTWKATEGAFYPLDVAHVLDGTEHGTPAEIAQIALEAGFMIGYRKGLKDARKGARK